MALFRPGSFAGQISGRLGGDVFSHNRYGEYIRKGTNPVTSTTPYALAAKAALSAASQAWQSLAADAKLAWKLWAQTNTTTNRLGQSITLTGHAAYVSLNARMLGTGFPANDVPPLIQAPAPLTSVALSPDIGLGAFDLTYTATPLAANDYLWIYAALVDSTGINYVQNLLRLVGKSGAAQASPFDPQALIEARLGALQVGQIIHLAVHVFEGVNGQLSAPQSTSAAVIST